MKQKLLIALLVFAFNSLNAQIDSVPIGTNSGAGSANNPVNYYGPMLTNSTGATWNRHAYIYPSSLYASLPSGTPINTIGFPRSTSTYFTFGTLTGTVSFKIYLKNTTAADFGAANLDWTTETATATLVYNGTSTDIINIVGNYIGLKKFPLSTNFTYTGGNIEMLVEYTQSAATTGDCPWEYDNSTKIPAYTTNQVKYISGTGNTPSSTTLSTSSATHPAVMLYFQGTGCTGVPTAGTIPFYINACQGNYTAVNVTGYSIENGIKLKWQQASTPSGPWTGVTGGSADSLSFYVTPNLYNTTYYRVKATCAYSLDSAFSNIDTIKVTHQPNALKLIMGFNTTTPLVECVNQDQVLDTAVLATPVTPSLVISSSIANPTGIPTATIYPQEGDRFISFNSYISDPYDAIRLKMPELTTKGIAGVDMYYWYYQLSGHKASNDNITVQYSFDNLNWITVPASTVNITNKAQDSTHNGWKKVFLSLPVAVANKDSVWIGLLLTSGNGYNILIDNVNIGATGTLPVKYLDIKAGKSGSFNKISWTTYQEQNNNFFEIERSNNGKEFVVIGKQYTYAVNGNSEFVINYSFMDNNPLAGNNYYRIKQTDRNGNIYYSEVVVVNADKINTLSLGKIYPNPSTNGRLTITVFSPGATQLMTTITDITGKLIKQFSHRVMMGDNELGINVADIEKGNYIICTSNGQTISNALMFEKR